MFDYSKIPGKYLLDSPIFELLYKRNNYSFYKYDNSNIRSFIDKRVYIENAKNLYEFYDNHPESGIKRPEDKNISFEDVIKYYHDLSYAEIKALSKQMKYSSIIPDEICQYKYDDKPKMYQNPIISLLIFLAILWAIMVFIIGISSEGLSLWTILECLFVMIIGSAFFFVDLLIIYFILQSIYVFIHNYLAKREYTQIENKYSEIAAIRNEQIRYLINKN
jgi:hypothetical protein